MRIATAQFYQNGVNGILDNANQLDETNQRLARGEKILTPSDDPVGAVRILNLETSLERLNQFDRNGDVAESKLAQEDALLDGMNNLLQRVRELAVRGNTDTLSAGDRSSIADEVLQHLDSFIQLANSKDANGEYIFAGFVSDTPPLSHNGIGGFTYNGDQGQQRLQIGEAREVAVGDHGERIFMNLPANAGGTTNIGAVLYDLAANLQAGNTDANALTDLDASLDRILETRSLVGARLNAIDDQRSANEALGIATQEVRSTLRDLDYAEAVAQFNQQQTALQAAQVSFLQIQDLSLFNFIN